MFLTGMLIGMAVLGLVVFIVVKSIPVRWYEWLLGTLGFGLLLFSLQNTISAGQEYWPGAPLIFFLVFGIPALLMIGIAIGLSVFRILKSNHANTENHITGK